MAETPNRRPGPAANSAHLLTQRERECLELVEQRLQSKEISRALGITFHTVNQHLQKAKEKLAAKDRREAAAIYRDLLSQGLWSGPALAPDFPLSVDDGDSVGDGDRDSFPQSFRVRHNPVGIPGADDLTSNLAIQLEGAYGQSKHADFAGRSADDDAPRLPEHDMGHAGGGAPGDVLRLSGQDPIRARLPVRSSQDVPIHARGGDRAQDLEPSYHGRVRGFPALGPVNTLTVVERLVLMTGAVLVGLILLGLSVLVLKALRS